jgi:hypothetical protein
MAGELAITARLAADVRASHCSALYQDLAQKDRYAVPSGAPRGLTGPASAAGEPNCRRRVKTDPGVSGRQGVKIQAALTLTESSEEGVPVG